MSLRVYFVLSFALFTVLCGAVTVNWAIVSDRIGLWPVLRLPLLGLGIVLTLWSAVMVVVALTSTYRGSPK